MFRYKSRSVVFGDGVSRDTGEYLKERGIGSVFCIYGQGVKAAGIADRIVASLEAAGIRAVCCDRGKSDPPVGLVDEIAALARGENVDAVLAVGGGSSIDTAKAVNILLTNAGSIADYFAMGAPQKPAKPLFLIPTTAGTGSEVTALTVVSDTQNKVKQAILHENCGAALAIIDPKLTWGASPLLTAYTGMDTLSHAIEAYTAVWHNPVTDVLALRAISLVRQHLQTAVREPENRRAREGMSLAAMLGGMCIDNVSVQLGHAISHAMTAWFHIPHGIACAYATPCAIDMMARGSGNETRLNEVAEAFGVSGGVRCLAEHIRAYYTALGIPPMSDYISDAGKLAEMAPAVCADFTIQLAPVKFSEPELRDRLLAEYR